MWQVFQMAKTYQERPSTLLGVTDEYSAFVLDRAVTEFGWFVEEELEKVQGKTSKQKAKNRQERLRKLTQEEGAPSKFADPAEMFGKGGKK